MLIHIDIADAMTGGDVSDGIVDLSNTRNGYIESQKNYVSKYHEYFDFYEGIETYNENQLSYMKNEVDWIEQNFITYKESIQSNLQQKDEFFSTNETPLEKLKTTSPLLAKKIVLVLIL